MRIWNFALVLYLWCPVNKGLGCLVLADVPRPIVWRRDLEILVSKRYFGSDILFSLRLCLRLALGAVTLLRQVLVLHQHCRLISQTTLNSVSTLTLEGRRFICIDITTSQPKHLEVIERHLSRALTAAHHSLGVIIIIINTFTLLRLQKLLLKYLRILRLCARGLHLIFIVLDILHRESWIGAFGLD